MSHVVTTPTAPFPSASGTLTVHQIPSAHDNLIWLIVDRQRGIAAAVDGPSATEVLQACKRLGVTLTTILNTHTHPDHIGINIDLGRRGALEGLTVYGPAGSSIDVPGLTHPVDEGSLFEFGSTEFRVMRTDGHLNGHVCYVAEDLLFCGDTMFGAGCGYLFDGPPAAMHHSLQRLSQLPAETRVCCAHEYTEDNLRFAWTIDPHNESLKSRIAETIALRTGGASTVPSSIGMERLTNPFLRTDDPRVRAALEEVWPERTFDGPVDYFAAARELKDRKDYRALPTGRLPL